VVIGHEPHVCDTTANPAANRKRSQGDALCEHQNDSLRECPRWELGRRPGAKVSDVPECQAAIVRKIYLFTIPYNTVYSHVCPIAMQSR
jgi:hypothetical protein